MNLLEFIVKAKKNTYANPSVKARKLKDGSKELIFKEGHYTYRDKYFGFNPFAGEEIVFQNDKAVWVMNYAGKTKTNPIFSKKIYTFLKKAMQQIKEEKPFRGPSNFKANNFEYRNKSSGDLSSFRGKEIIFYKDKEVYSLEYHGGFVKK